MRESYNKLLIIHALHVLVGVELILELPVVCLVRFVDQLTEIVSCKRFFDFEISHLFVHLFFLSELLHQDSLLRGLVFIIFVFTTSSRAHVALSAAAKFAIVPQGKVSTAIADFHERVLIE